MSVPRTVKVLGLVSLFTDVAGEMIYPMLPVFLTSTLGASPAAIGVVEGFAETTASLLKAVSGRYADRLPRRKPLVLGGYALSTLARPLIGLAGSWPAVLAIRVCDRIGKGVRSPPRDALIADVTPEAGRGEAYGFHRSMDHAGAVLGPLVAVALLQLPGATLRSVFLCSAIPGIAAVLTIAFGVRESRREVKKSAPMPLSWSGLRALDPNYRRLLGAVTVFTLGNSTDAFLPSIRVVGAQRHLPPASATHQLCAPRRPRRRE